MFALLLRIAPLSNLTTELALKLGGNDNLGTRLLHDRLQSRLGLAGICEAEGGTGLHDTKEADQRPHGLLEAQRYSGTDRDTLVLDEMACQPGGELVQLGVSEGAVP
ncbi:unnamed protein product [Clonostachys rosea]|uniref:Uncharacterized protein n=1 Tax=Bionectria ochroleuca TaxID=29856 RepID=A0ABY6UVD3_BIOOC|nr:unnamed protein product [Clonostachys rosea]